MYWVDEYSVDKFTGRRIFVASNKLQTILLIDRISLVLSPITPMYVHIHAYVYIWALYSKGGSWSSFIVHCELKQTT
jgi:hypothetical protein